MARAKSAFLSLAASLENMSHAASFEKWRPQALSVLRIVVALLFLQSGFEKFFGFPPGPQLAGVIILAAAIDTIGLLRWSDCSLDGSLSLCLAKWPSPISWCMRQSQSILRSMAETWQCSIPSCFYISSSLVRVPGAWTTR
jgi:putative oxidoreductase